MNKHTRPVVRILMAGAALSIGMSGCKKDVAPEGPPMTSNPPPPEPEPELDPIGPGNPPAPEPTLPTWDEAKSGHPEGATNPPMPYLRVTPDGECYKGWRGAMRPPSPGEVIGDRVEACEQDCGTHIQCPQPRAQELLDAYAAGGEAPATKSNPPEPDGL